MRYVVELWNGSEWEWDGRPRKLTLADREVPLSIMDAEFGICRFHRGEETALFLERSEVVMIYRGMKPEAPDA